MFNKSNLEQRGAASLWTSELVDLSMTQSMHEQELVAKSAPSSKKRGGERECG